MYLFAQAGISFITFAGLALLLSTREFAPASVALGVVVIAGALADLGLSPTTISVLPARLALMPEASAQILSGAAKAFYWAAGVALLLPLIVIPGLDHSSRLCVLAIAPAAPAYVFVAAADSILRTGGEFRRPVLLVGLSRLGGWAALPTAAVTGSGPWSCAAVTFGTLAATAPAFRFVARVRAADPTASAGDTVRTSLPLGLSQVFVVLGGRADTVILGTAVSAAAAAAFETAWRFFQIGQYFAGAVSTGVAPFLGDALGRHRRDELDRLLLRALAIVTVAGFLFSGLTLVLRRPITELLVGDVAAGAASALLPLALVSPLAFAGFVGTIALSMSRSDRRIILVANVLGATTNLALALILIPHHHAAGAGVAAATGLVVTQTVILGRLVAFRRRLREAPDIGRPPASIERV